MQNGFPYLDILIFGIIAVFLIFRLKNVLGTKSGFDETNTNQQRSKKQFSNVIPMKSENKVDKGNIYDDIKKVDVNFDENEFLSGTSTFFKMVLEAFVEGNLDNVKDYIKPSVLKSFRDVILERNNEQETLIINLKSIEKNQIISTQITKKNIRISVDFESLQIKALKDKDGQLIDGNLDEEILVKDNWVFERLINNTSPNWTLIETKSY